MYFLILRDTFVTILTLVATFLSSHFEKVKIITFKGLTVDGFTN